MKNKIYTAQEFIKLYSGSGVKWRIVVFDTQICELFSGEVKYLKYENQQYIVVSTSEFNIEVLSGKFQRAPEIIMQKWIVAGYSHE